MVLLGNAGIFFTKHAAMPGHPYIYMYSLSIVYTNFKKAVNTHFARLFISFIYHLVTNKAKAVQ